MSTHIDPETLPPMFGVQVASRVLGIGKNQTYALISKSEYPVRVRRISGRWKVSRYDLLQYLGAPSQTAEGKPAQQRLSPAEDPTIPSAKVAPARSDLSWRRKRRISSTTIADLWPDMETEK